ncbi:MAG TPA: integration host factor subunit alpha [Legionellales bacterium]|nr:integration host factor subunit alpha [Legionellales bacterium]
MSALSKAKIIESLAEKLKLEKSDARLLVESFFETIRQNLFTGHHVRISGFGNFILRDKKARPGRNPKTGEEIPVSARRVVTFRPGMKLKEKVHAFTKKRLS